MVKVVICNGKPGSGKTTVQDIAKRLCLCDNTAHYWFGNAMPTVVDTCSTVDFVKEAYEINGWNLVLSEKVTFFVFCWNK